MKILFRNFRCKIGEIDIIAKDKDYWVFIEVKFRRTTEKGFSSEAVDYKKIKKICKVSDYFRMTNGLDENTPVRYDVLSIQGEEIEWIHNAFEYCN